MPDAYKNARLAPTDLASGRVLGPGEAAPADAFNFDNPHDARLRDEGSIIEAVLPEPDPELAGEALEQRARDLGIEGRSRMTADELRAAVADAELNQGAPPAGDAAEADTPEEAGQ